MVGQPEPRLQVHVTGRNGPEIKTEKVDHPVHYGGEEDVYETIKVIEAWGLGFHLGNCVKYISRAGKKEGSGGLEDLEKARWYLDRVIKNYKGEEDDDGYNGVDLTPEVGGSG